MTLLLLAVAPVVFLLVYVYIRDKYEHEPVGLLLKVFFAGILATIPVIVVETWLEKYNPVQLTGQSNAAYTAFVVAGVTEELFKYLVFAWLIWRNKNFNEPFDGIVYAVFISLGFAMAENIAYVMQMGFSTGITRAFTAVPAHALFGVTMGYYFSQAKFSTQSRPYLLKAFLVPVVLHGFYDFLLISPYKILLLLFLPYVIYLWRSGLKKMKELSDQSQFKTRLEDGNDNY